MNMDEWRRKRRRNARIKAAFSWFMIFLGAIFTVYSLWAWGILLGIIR